MRVYNSSDIILSVSLEEVAFIQQALVTWRGPYGQGVSHTLSQQEIEFRDSATKAAKEMAKQIERRISRRDP